MIAGAAVAHAAPPTFSKDVAPIFFARCAGCHRPGDIGPMSLITYKQVRPWAKAIREHVADKTMPPWQEDSKTGQFANDRRLSKPELRTILAWIDAGAPEGDPRALPTPPAFVEGWNIGKPDVVFTTPEFEVPASGTVSYQYYAVPTFFTEDRWVEAMEIRPGDRSVVHHVGVILEQPGHQAGGVEALVVPPAHPGETRAKGQRIEDMGIMGGGDGQGELFCGYTPGERPVTLPSGAARLIKAGALFKIVIHYTTSGKVARDRTSLGLRFAKEPGKWKINTRFVSNFGLEIPAGDANYLVVSEVNVNEPIHLLSVTPHMHLRGKTFHVSAIFPDGHEQSLLSIPRFDFNWMGTVYQERTPIALPKGTHVVCKAEYDNSTANKANPDATKTIHWGEQNWDEMMQCNLQYVADAEYPQAARAK
jgi:hypothetical protein